MKRFLILCAVALTLGGCAGTLPPIVERIIGLPAGVLTADIPQPVTRKMYRNISNGGIVVVVGLNIYKRKCEAGSIGASCFDAIERVQVYTRKLCSAFVQGHCQTGVLADLRAFVRNNDQVNARIAYNTATQLLASIRNTAAATGIPGVK